jgi:hypothetical protein
MQRTWLYNLVRTEPATAIPAGAYPEHSWAAAYHLWDVYLVAAGGSAAALLLFTAVAAALRADYSPDGTDAPAPSALLCAPCPLWLRDANASRRPSAAAAEERTGLAAGELRYKEPGRFFSPGLVEPLPVGLIHGGGGPGGPGSPSSSPPGELTNGRHCDAPQPTPPPVASAPTVAATAPLPLLLAAGIRESLTAALPWRPSPADRDASRKDLQNHGGSGGGSCSFQVGGAVFAAQDDYLGPAAPAGVGPYYPSQYSSPSQYPSQYAGVVRDAQYRAYHPASINLDVEGDIGVA